MTGSPNRTEPVPRHLSRLARLLDSAIPLPGNLRIGLDGLIGLIPGVGDALGLALSTYIVLASSAHGAPRSVLLRMALNVFIDSLLGAVPLLGDLFDFAFKANERNMALLEAYSRDPTKTRQESRLLGAAIALVACAGAAGVLVLAVWLMRMLWRAVA